MVDYSTAHKIMPPWRADLTKNTFVGMKNLSADEIEKISAWVEARVFPYGDTTIKEKIPKIETLHAIGRPDISMHYKKGFKMPASKNDLLLHLLLPIEQ